MPVVALGQLSRSSPIQNLSCRPRIWSQGASLDHNPDEGTKITRAGPLHLYLH